MTSRPPQQQRQRQASPTQRPSSSEQAKNEAQADRSNSQSPSSKSVDSQTLLLNDPATSNADRTASPRPQGEDSIQQDDTSEPRKCWICFSDETEDTPQNHATWKTPCPCALTAHEPCLLDWIADMEAPQSGRATGSKKEIKCPQCKSNIQLARPHSAVLDLVSAAEKLGGHLLLPSVIAGSVYTMMLVSSHHGEHTIRMIFGTAGADAILADSPYQSLLEARLQQYIPFIARPFFRHWRGWRVEFGLPLIPMALIASRTHLADSIMPLLPIAFFAAHPDQAQELAQGVWPPSAAMTLVVLPYARGVYEEYLERVWGERERAWMKEVRPRSGDEEGTDENGDDNRDAAAQAEDMVQLQIEIEDAVDEEEEEAERAEPPPDIEHPVNQAPRNEVGQGENAEVEAVRGEDGQPAPNQQVGDGQQPAQHQHQHHQHHRRLDISLVTTAARIAEVTVGALFFPTISAVMGEALRLALPTAWTMPRTSLGRPVPSGILQTRWGRSIVGGCLFVVIKDAVRIYCRWKMAQSYRHRKVLNFDREQGRVVG